MMNIIRALQKSTRFSKFSSTILVKPIAKPPSAHTTGEAFSMAVALLVCLLLACLLTKPALRTGQQLHTAHVRKEIGDRKAWYGGTGNARQIYTWEETLEATDRRIGYVINVSPEGPGTWKAKGQFRQQWPVACHSTPIPRRILSIQQPRWNNIF